MNASDFDKKFVLLFDNAKIELEKVHPEVKEEITQELNRMKDEFLSYRFTKDTDLCDVAVRIYSFDDPLGDYLCELEHLFRRRKIMTEIEQKKKNQLH